MQHTYAWYTTLSGYLQNLGFHQSKSDSSLFICALDIVAYFCIYVDDLILTGNSTCFNNFIIQSLHSKFSIKDWDMVHYFLGVEVLPVSNGLFLCQQKYVRDLLHRTNLEGPKPVYTLMATTVHLYLDDGSPATDSTEFRLSNWKSSISLPHIASYCLSYHWLAKFMHRPTEQYWNFVKLLLRYLKNTLHHCLLLSMDAENTSTPYSDANWVGNADDRTFTSAFVLFFQEQSYLLLYMEAKCRSTFLN